MKQKPWSYCIKMKIVWIFSHIFMWFDRLSFLFFYFNCFTLQIIILSIFTTFFYFKNFWLLICEIVWTKNFMSWCLKIQKYVHFIYNKKKRCGSISWVQPTSFSLHSYLDMERHIPIVWDTLHSHIHYCGLYLGAHIVILNKFCVG
jgi:hypothetical protein